MIITDSQFDTVYLSSYPFDLEPDNQLYPLKEIFRNLTDKLKEHNIDVRPVPYKDDSEMTRKLSIWSRDYMPVQVSDRHFVQFVYSPDYLNFKKYFGHVPDTGWIDRQIAEEGQFSEGSDFYLSFSDIILDGGNLVRCGDYVVMTEKVFEENPGKSPARLLDQLEALFGAEIILLPWDTREIYGHTDGLLRYVGGNTVVYETYGLPGKDSKDKRFNSSFLRHLAAKLDVRVLDFSDIDKQHTEEQQVNLRWAYMNWLQVGNLVIMPEFRQTPLSNDYARKFVSDTFKDAGTDAVVECVEATELVKLGGCFNCASWTVKSPEL